MRTTRSGLNKVATKYLGNLAQSSHCNPYTGQLILAELRFSPALAVDMIVVSHSFGVGLCVRSCHCASSRWGCAQVKLFLGTSCSPITFIPDVEIHWAKMNQTLTAWTKKLTLLVLVSQEILLSNRKARLVHFSKPCLMLHGSCLGWLCIPDLDKALHCPRRAHMPQKMLSWAVDRSAIKIRFKWMHVWHVLRWRKNTRLGEDEPGGLALKQAKVQWVGSPK